MDPKRLGRCQYEKAPRYKEDLPAELKQKLAEVKEKLPDQLVDV